MIRIQDVTKTYYRGTEEIRALDHVFLEVADGEFLAIMGASGSGKSTLLNMIGGIDTPDSGEVWIADENLARMSDDSLTLFRRRKLGFVFQFFNLLSTLSVWENVALPLLMDGCPPDEVRARVETALEQVGLANRREHRPGALSGGEMQRVAIARAVVIEPVVLIADEPTGNLDSRTGEEVLTLLKATSHKGQTIVMVTHDAHAAAYGDRIITLKDGQVVSDLNPTRRLEVAR